MSDAPGNQLYKNFGQTLRRAMEAKGLNSSDLARLVWGEVTDRRGYKVARNRDRIGHYLAGKSFPNDANLHKIADALKLPCAELAATRSPSGPVPAGVATGKVRLDATREQLNAIRQLCPRIRLETALKIIELLEADRLGQKP